MSSWCKTCNSDHHRFLLIYISRGVGVVFWIPLISVYGRAPVLFYTTLAGTLLTLGCILAPSFSVFYGLRTIQSFFFTALQTIGLAFIQDMFFFHEHAKKIGIWTSCFLVSPYVGPLFANFIVWGTDSWRAPYWMVFGLGCLVLILVVLFIDEPWYRRDIAPENQPPNGIRIFKVLGLWQLRNHNGYFLNLSTGYRRLTSVLIKPVIILIMIY
jgi:MFS family permease